MDFAHVSSEGLSLGAVFYSETDLRAWTVAWGDGSVGCWKIVAVWAAEIVVQLEVAPSTGGSPFWSIVAVCSVGSVASGGDAGGGETDS